jgi:pantoate--beta-alanine ligase
MAIPVEIAGVETVREENGLACSSRNSFLDSAEREIAAKLYHQLEKVKKSLLKGKETVRRIESRAMKALEKAGFEPQFVSVCRRADLAPAGRDDRELVVLAAARLGGVRLIDNIEVRLH